MLHPSQRALCSPIQPPSLTCAASEIPICSPAQECAANAIRDLAKNAVRTAALRDVFLSIPARVNLLAFEGTNACKVLEAVCEAVGTLPAGHHAAPLALVFQPIISVLSAFVQNPEAACVAAAAQGLLLACATHYDGIIRKHQIRMLGIDEGTAEALVSEGRRNRGAVTWNPAVYRVEKVSSAIVASMLHRLNECMHSLRVDHESHRIAAGIQPYRYGESKQTQDEREGELLYQLTACPISGLRCAGNLAFVQKELYS